MTCMTTFCTFVWLVWQAPLNQKNINLISWKSSNFAAEKLTNSHLEQKIKNVIEGYRKKIYGEQDKNGNYIKKRLPDKHNEWKGRDKTFGNKIFNSLKNR